MPVNPEPVGAPDQMKFLRWVKSTLESIIADAQRKEQTDSNINSTQNATMTMLVNRLGDVTAGINDIIADAVFDGSQITTGTVDAARLDDIDASKIVSGTLTRPVDTTGDILANGHGEFNAAWNYDVSAVTRRAVWMDAAGRMGHTSSSERFKKDIQAWSPSEQAVLAMELVRFHWREEYGSDKHWEYGVVAEQLHDLGLNWLVSYEEDGVTPHSVHYERMSLALLPFVQDLVRFKADTLDRLDALEQKVSDLEND